MQPASKPSALPSLRPTSDPRSCPSSIPSTNPSTQSPSGIPTEQPALNPSQQPTRFPSAQPLTMPSSAPSKQPFKIPSSFPSINPTTSPLSLPTCQLTETPSCEPVSIPSSLPSLCPSCYPSSCPFPYPSQEPSQIPTEIPSSQPYFQPSSMPSDAPSDEPALYPSSFPSIQPSSRPRLRPFSQPTDTPTVIPSIQPSLVPSLRPRILPSFSPTVQPSLVPSLQPISYPTVLPSLDPTLKPTIYPSIQPVTLPSRCRPSQMPSAEPTHQPSCSPTTPTAKPTTRPTGPSSKPSSAPTAPSGQPTVSPSRQPYILPSMAPPHDPSVQPSHEPYTNPTILPRSRPTIQPSKQPVCIPSKQPRCHPSSYPSRQPHSRPSYQPSTMPTIDGKACSLSTFYFSIENRCKPCPRNSDSYSKGSLTCTCNAAYIQSSAGNSLKCTPCPAGYAAVQGAVECSICPAGFYSFSAGSGSCSICPAGAIATVNGSTVCTLCAPGHYSPLAGAMACQSVPPGHFAVSPGSTSYQICDQGTYSEVAAQAECNTCSPGTVTANFGSVSSEDCVSPRINFIAGYICIVVAAAMSSVYIVFARFNQLSFERQEKYVRPVAERMKSFTRDLDLDIVKLLSKLKDVRSENTSLSSTVRVLCFCMAVVVIIPGSAIVLILSIMRKVFFNLLIGWKGLNLGSMRSMIEKCMALVEQVTGPLLIPSDLVAFLFYPLVLICKLVDAVNIDGFYSLLSVTCQGAKAPIELFIDSFVLGVSILFIKSNYNFLWAMTFREMNRALVVKYWMEGKEVLSFSFILAVLFLLLASMNPFVTLLRFFLAYVNFAAFFVNNHVTHALSKACIGIVGFQNQELLLVYATSILVWLLIPPIVYSISEIVCPKGGYTIFEISKPVLSDMQSIVEVTPTGLPDTGENGGSEASSSSSIGSVVISEYNESEIPSVDTGSIVISEFSRGDTDSNFDFNAKISIGDSIPSSSSASDDVAGGVAVPSFIESETDYSIGDNFSSKNSESDTDYSIGESFRSIGLTPDEHASDSEDAGTIGKSDYHLTVNIDDDNISRHWYDAHSTAADREESEQRQVADIESLAVVQSSVVGLTNRGIAMVMCQYAWSRVRAMFSADLLIVFVIHVYLSRCQKAFRLEQQRKLRANLRWGSQTVPQSIERFRVERLEKHDTNWHSKLLQHQIDSEKDLASKLAAQIADDSKDCRLPPYYQLCFMVQKELCEILRVVYTLRPVSIPISYLLAFSGIGHPFTTIGFEFWTVVIGKYIIFLCACLGIWLNKIYEAYGIEALVKEFTNSDPDEATIEFLKLTIASRVILLQALGETPTLISIVVISICEAPLFVFSPELREKIPPLLHMKPRALALAREKKEVLGKGANQGQGQGQGQSEDGNFQIQEWVLTTRSISIFLTESRLIVFLYNLVSLSLTIFILKGVEISTEILALLLAAMLPYFVGSTLIPILYIGKRLNLTDEDFYIVFWSWLSKPYEYCRATAVRIAAYFSHSMENVYSSVFDYTRSRAVHPINQEAIEDAAVLEEEVVTAATEPVGQIGIPLNSESAEEDGLVSEVGSIHIVMSEEDDSSTDESCSIAGQEEIRRNPLQTNESGSDADSSSVNISEEDIED